MKPRDMTRAEHMQWCKDRAMEYVNRGDLVGAVASMISDLDKHPGTSFRPNTTLIAMWAAEQAIQGDTEGVKRFILGFN
jgi:hypothetical protein